MKINIAKLAVPAVLFGALMLPLAAQADPVHSNHGKGGLHRQHITAIHHRVHHLKRTNHAIHHLKRNRHHR